ncbi:MAG TPA: cell division protein FtsH, partial [Gemmatimonadales bacterium]|nr:cell division protein FtsH [Gemmatimonadales bacterium]
EKVTTGAGSDIEQATSLARRMVTQFGMSEKIGMMAVGEREHEVFLGREFGTRREVSERTAEVVDDEVKRFIDEAYRKATNILNEHRDLLERIALTLLDRETVDRDDLDRIVRGETLPPRTPTLPPASPVASVPPSKPAPAPRPPGILGAPGAEPAGA